MTSPLAPASTAGMPAASLASSPASASVARKRPPANADFLARVEASSKRSKGGDGALRSAADSSSAQVAPAPAAAAAETSDTRVKAEPDHSISAERSRAPPSYNTLAGSSFAAADSSAAAAAPLHAAAVAASSFPVDPLAKTEVDPSALQSLQELGFSRAQAAAALQHCGGSAVAAADLLLSGGDAAGASAAASASAPAAAASSASSRAAPSAAAERSAPPRAKATAPAKIPRALRDATLSFDDLPPSPPSRKPAAAAAVAASAAPAAAVSASSARAAPRTSTAAAGAPPGVSAEMTAATAAAEATQGLSVVTAGVNKFITFRAVPGGNKCTCVRPSSGGSRIMTFASLAASSAATARCGACSLRGVEQLPSSLASTRKEVGQRYRCTLRQFLDVYKPARVGPFDAHWVAVSFPKPAPAAASSAAASSSSSRFAASSAAAADDLDDEDGAGVDMDALMSGWEALSEKDRTPASMRALAERSGYTSGKWLVSARPESIEFSWGRIVLAMAAGLIPGVTAAKVSSSNEGLQSQQQTHMICVYTRNWLDEADVMRVREALRAHAGIHWKIHYKADCYTTLGVYAGTHRAFKKASVYSA